MWLFANLASNFAKEDFPKNNLKLNDHFVVLIKINKLINTDNNVTYAL